jgi:hypothetical protein
MKTVQVGDGKVKVIQFENLKEIQKIFTEGEIVERFNFAYRTYIANALRYKEDRKESIKEAQRRL